MKGKIGDKQRLAHILESIEELEDYTAGSNLDTFLQNSMMRFASVKQIEIIGEVANYISDETKEKFSEIQWRQITGLRHVCNRQLQLHSFRQSGIHRNRQQLIHSFRQQECR
ncbi:MAG: hypothetical protein RLZZ520_654, partial [Bacteroidota bacterium]